MAEGEGRTLEEAFDKYAEHKSAEVMESLSSDISFQEGMATFEAYHDVDISVKVRAANQWVKGYKVKDRDR